MDGAARMDARGVRLAVALGGTDLGRSDFGICVRSVVPRLRQRIEPSGGKLIAIGTGAEPRAKLGSHGPRVARCLSGHIEPAEHHGKP
jgi:hypothetical protein